VALAFIAKYFMPTRERSIWYYWPRISYRQAAEIFSKEIGKKVFHIDIPEEDTPKGMKEIGMEDWFIDAMMAGFNCIIRGVMHGKTTTVVEQITGRKQDSFAQFAKDYSEFCRSDKEIKVQDCYQQQYRSI